MSEITLKNVRPLFLTKEGPPKKEFLITTKDTFRMLGIKISENIYERSWQIGLMNSVYSALYKYFREHNCNMIRCKMDNEEVLRGFTKNKGKILNSLKRDNKRLKVAEITYTKSKELAEGQLQMTFNFKEIEE